MFKPLSSASLRNLTCKTLFLVALATAKRVGELQTLSRVASFSSSSAGLSYVPEFLAKTETAVRPLPRTFAIQSLGDFAAGLHEDLLLCLVRSLLEYVARTSKFVNRPHRLFVSPRCPSCAMSRNGISFFLREVIVHSGASSEAVAAPRAHSIRGIATSSAFFHNWSWVVFLKRSHGALIQHLLNFIYVIYSVFLREFAPWVPLPLLESALVSLHLFLISSGGGGSVILVPFP